MEWEIVTVKQCNGILIIIAIIIIIISALCIIIIIIFALGRPSGTNRRGPAGDSELQ